MLWRRFWAIFSARNKEFLRDKTVLGWNIAFPILLIFGFGFIFSGDGKAQYKVGLLGEGQSQFNQTQYIQFVPYQQLDKALLKVQQHSLDLLVENSQRRYWVNAHSPQGYLAEKLLLQAEPGFQRQETSGRAIRYVDWLLPGILGMNMMFSSLFGVGYVVVRYRKNSVLKRLQTTQLTASEFILAQVVSRLMIVMLTVSILYIGCHWFVDFYMIGSYIDLFIVNLVGAMAMISLGLVISCRSQSEEFVGGLLNMLSWPMMVLSGVWFSLEGAPDIILSFAQFFPLTHIIDASRSVMTNGDSLWDLRGHLLSLVAMTMIFTVVGSLLFRWDSENR